MAISVYMYFTGFLPFPTQEQFSTKAGDDCRVKNLPTSKSTHTSMVCSSEVQAMTTCYGLSKVWTSRCRCRRFSNSEYPE